MERSVVQVSSCLVEKEAGIESQSLEVLMVLGYSLGGVLGQTWW